MQTEAGVIRIYQQPLSAKWMNNAERWANETLDMKENRKTLQVTL